MSRTTTKGSSTFQRYDTEFQEILQQIEQSVQQQSQSPTDNTTSSNSNTEFYTNNLIQQGHDLLKQMSVEARSIPSGRDDGTKNELLQQIRTWKSQLTTLQSKVATLGLFGNNNINNNNGTNNYDTNRKMLQQNETMMQQQNETLERAKRSIMETEAVALEINDELQQNRETLLSSQNRIRQVSDLTNTAKKVLTAMNQRQVQQKMILYGITFGLIIGFFFLLYSMWG